MNFIPATHHHKKWNSWLAATGLTILVIVIPVLYLFLTEDLPMHERDLVLMTYGFREWGIVIESHSYGVMNRGGGSGGCRVAVLRQGKAPLYCEVMSTLPKETKVEVLIVDNEGWCDRAEDVSWRLAEWPASSKIVVLCGFPFVLVFFAWLLKK